MEPFFEDGYPRPLLYGRLGVKISLAILSSILPYGNLWTSDRKILSPFHSQANESLQYVQASIECLSRAIFDTGFDIPSTRVAETARAVLAELSAGNVAHEALLAVSNADSHRHYGGLDQYEDSALYFLSFAQTLCSDSTKEYQIYENVRHFQLPGKLRLDLAWSQFNDFHAAFGCAPSKAEKCIEIF